MIRSSDTEILLEKKQFYKTIIKNDVNDDEELNCIDIKDSPILVFIDDECGNLIVANDRGELTRNINQKKKSDALQ